MYCWGFLSRVRMQQRATKTTYLLSACYNKKIFWRVLSAKMNSVLLQETQQPFDEWGHKKPVKICEISLSHSACWKTVFFLLYIASINIPIYFPCSSIWSLPTPNRKSWLFGSGQVGYGAFIRFFFCYVKLMKDAKTIQGEGNCRADDTSLWARHYERLLL